MARTTKRTFTLKDSFILWVTLLKATWHGHSSYSALNWFTHKFSQAWSLMHSIMHWPKSILFCLVQISRLSLFCGERFSPHAHIGLGQSEQPSGQFILHGQSELKHLNPSYFVSRESVSPFTQSVKALPHSRRQFVSEQEIVQSIYPLSHCPSHMFPRSSSLKITAV